MSDKEEGLTIDLGEDSLREMSQSEENAGVESTMIENDKKQKDLIDDYSAKEKKDKKNKKKGNQVNFFGTLKKDKSKRALFIALSLVAVFALALIYGIWNMKVIKTEIANNVHLIEEVNKDNTIREVVKSNPIFGGSDIAQKTDKTSNKVSLYDLIDMEEGLKQERDRMEAKYSRYEAPYDYFLDYVYLPRLNVWKNPFTEKVNIELFGKNYLDANPYVDTTLLGKWSDFFSENSYVGGLRNDLKTITISELEIDDENYTFNIPMTVGVKVDDRRTFLAMLSKITMTANTKTIMDINEFTYYFWEALVEHYEEEFVVGKTSEFEKEYKNAEEVAKSIKQTEKLYKADENGNDKLDYARVELYMKNLYKESTLRVVEEDYPYIDNEDMLHFFVLRKRLNFTYEQLEDMQAYRKDVENGVENLETTIIESEHYPVYMRYLELDFELTQDEMEAMKRDVNPIYKFVGMRLYHWTKECTSLDNPPVYNGYDVCRDSIRIPDSVIIRAVHSYANNGIATEFPSEISANDAKLFRKNMQDIPFIAYSIGLECSNDCSTIRENLHEVYNSIPPLIKIGEFRFAQLQNNSVYGDGYDVDLNMSVYGKGITEEEIVEIQEEIAVNCGMRETQKFTVDVAIERVDNRLEKLYNDDVNNKSQYVFDLKELKIILEEDKAEFENENKSSFDKIIILLEAYRMLFTKGYCEPNKDEANTEE